MAVVHVNRQKIRKLRKMWIPYLQLKCI